MADPVVLSTAVSIQPKPHSQPPSPTPTTVQVQASPRQAKGATAGQLHVWVGPMFSGKSTALQQHAHTAAAADYHVLVIQHAKDDRYDVKRHMTHTGQTYPAIRVAKLADVLQRKDYARSDVVLVDEAQFYDDLHVVHDTMVERHHKCVFVFGLDGDKHQNPFRHVTDLVAKAESYTKIRAVCAECARQRRVQQAHAPLAMHGVAALDNAPFSVYLGTDQARFVVGGANVYEARCRLHIV